MHKRKLNTPASSFNNTIASHLYSHPPPIIQFSFQIYNSLISALRVQKKKNNLSQVSSIIFNFILIRGCKQISRILSNFSSFPSFFPWGDLVVGQRDDLSTFVPRRNKNRNKTLASHGRFCIDVSQPVYIYRGRVINLFTLMRASYILSIFEEEVANAFEQAMRFIYFQSPFRPS